MGLADLVKDTSKDHTSVDASATARGCCLIQIPTDLELLKNFGRDTGASQNPDVES